ncbi:uncharacterized protein Dwil_GK28031 [Drosophila willistoni]|uniref:Uncharacterized protein n=1 Tax=Drosophila willistoni TaxID=7260 RepID=A0A0Q9WVN9_DROWI|nr:uncharacterized protein Dwil_GK28031 [Drosophila willistoni]
MLYIDVGHLIELQYRDAGRSHTNFERHFKQMPTADKNRKVFDIKPAENALIRFNYSNRKHTNNIAAASQTEYFLNFNFGNYRNPKEKKHLDKSKSKRSQRTRRLGNGLRNPYNYLPIKGEDIF